jgi:excisionase family DNA binding protein
MPRYMTVKSLAEHIGKHERTVRRWCIEGTIKAMKDPGGRDWLILETEFDRVVEQTTEKHYDKLHG